jgi:hypothetical protein
VSYDLTFGKYRLVQRLAYGGMAEVFLARVSGAAGFEKDVVIKRLHPQFCADRDFVAMLIDEAHIASQLAHTNICQVLDLGEVEGTYYLALEYIDGHDLFTVMRRLRRGGEMLPLPAAAYVVNEVLEGLGYAHRKKGSDGRPLGIVHRDVSPQNVLITNEGEVKIIDFGIAKARISSTKTQAGILKGKYRYMAPEQAEGRTVDQRSDLFSVGIVLYELLAGQVHGRGLSDMQLLERVRSAQFEPLRTFRPDLPPVLEELVERALDREPARRFQTAQEFQDALSGFLHATGLEFTKRDLGAMVRRLFPEGSVPARPVDENQTVQGTPSSRLTRDAFHAAMTGAAMTAIERPEELEELGEDDLEELDEGGAPLAAARPAWTPAETVDRTPRHDVVEAAPVTAERVRRVGRPARRRGAREVVRAAGPAPAPTPADAGGSTSDRPLGLRAPVAEPFEEPPPPAPAPAPPPAPAPAPALAPDPAWAGQAARPSARAPAVSAERPPAGRAAPPPAEPSRPARPAPPPADEPRAVAEPRAGGLSRAGKIAAFATVLLLGSAAVGVLLLYNPSAFQPRPRSAPQPAPTGSLYVTSRPAGAAITINGKPTGRRTPDTIDDLPTNRTLRLELALEGYQPWALEVSVSGDDPTPVMAELTREGGGRAPKEPAGREPGRRRGPR